MIRDAYILAGGSGTRLKSYTDKPKSLLKIYEKPFILDLLKWCILNQLLNIKIIIAKNQKKIFEKELENYSELGFLRKIKIKLIEEDKKMGTAGWLLKNINYLPEQFIVMNADTYYSENIIEKIEKARLSKYSVIFGYEENIRKDSGFIKIDEDQKVTSFKEKLVTSKISSSGIYLFKKEHLNISPFKKIDKTEVSLEEDIFPILSKNSLLKCFPNTFKGIYDFGTLERIEKAKDTIKKNKFKWLIVDRDNTLNEDKNGYTNKIDDFKIIDKLLPTLQGYQKNGFFICICTNQSGIGRGYYSREQMDIFNNRLIEELRIRYNIFINELVFCPHHPNLNCSCRKPKTGLLDSLEKMYSIDWERSVFIGDSEADKKMSEKLGLTFLHFIEFK